MLSPCKKYLSIALLFACRTVWGEENILQQQSDNSTIKAFSICTGHEGIPICLSSLSDLTHFSTLQQLSFDYHKHVRDAPLYSLKLDDSNVPFIRKIAAKGTWIEYEYNGIQFKLQLGVHDHLYGHYSFNFYLNNLSKSNQKSKIIKIRVIGSHLQDIFPHKTISITYDLHWTHLSDEATQFQETVRKIPWYSLINSSVMLCVMLAVVTFLYVRSTNGQEIVSRIFGIGTQLTTTNADSFENGWKVLYADVFRAPVMSHLFAIAVGIGAQILTALPLNHFVSFLLPGKSNNWTIFLFSYCTSGWIGGMTVGFVGSSYNLDHMAQAVKAGCILQTILIMLLFATFKVLFGSLKSSIGPNLVELAFLLCSFAFINAPLSIVSGSLGSKLSTLTKFPYKPSVKKRKLKTDFTYQTIFLIVASGILPFISLMQESLIFDIEFRQDFLYYVFLLVISCGLSCTSSILVSFTMLNAENYCWQWLSFCSGGISSIYFYLWSICNIFFRLYSFSFVPFCIYALKVGIACSLLFVLQGSVSYLACQWFIRGIYSSIKFD